jgi:hypothetical protein
VIAQVDLAAIGEPAFRLGAGGDLGVPEQVTLEHGDVA